MVKRYGLIGFIGFCLLLPGPLWGNSHDGESKSGNEKTAAKSPTKASKAQSAKVFPAYRPPRRGAPLVRVGGGTRGVEYKHPTLQVLAPEHTGLTTMAQPSLYWYVSGPTSIRFEFTIIDDDSIEPVMESVLKPPAKG
ncbi:MAG: DUF928 domain-containing protein, partial [Gammaproteobacteria bacterium]|nr:DUF928 domain-containing protein [Gammaproteobacteria bacterium]